MKFKEPPKYFTTKFHAEALQLKDRALRVALRGTSHAFMLGAARGWEASMKRGRPPKFLYSIHDVVLWTIIVQLGPLLGEEEREQLCNLVRRNRTAWSDAVNEGWNLQPGGSPSYSYCVHVPPRGGTPMIGMDDSRTLWLRVDVCETAKRLRECFEYLFENRREFSARNCFPWLPSQDEKHAGEEQPMEEGKVRRFRKKG